MRGEFLQGLLQRQLHAPAFADVLGDGDDAGDHAVGVAERLLLSGHARVLERIDAVRGLGPIEIMPKPWDDEQLCLAISRLVLWRQQQFGPVRPAADTRPAIPARRLPMY